MHRPSIPWVDWEEVRVEAYPSRSQEVQEGDLASPEGIGAQVETIVGEAIGIGAVATVAPGIQAAGILVPGTSEEGEILDPGTLVAAIQDRGILGVVVTLAPGRM